MDQPSILIVGAGFMGRAVAHFFIHHPDGPYRVMLADRDETVLDNAEKALAGNGQIGTMHLDVRRSDSLLRALEGVKVCVSCVPYFLNRQIVKACLVLGVSYVDLGMRLEITDEVLAMDADAKARGVSLVPDTGFSPGLLNILAWELVGRFKNCEELSIRAGGLPQQPVGPLKYTQFFSIHGLVNEYFEDAREIRDGRVTTVPSLSDLETVEFPGYGSFEAFVTSGGTSTLTRTLDGKLRRLSYKTIRYPGHIEALQYLRDLGLAENQPYSFHGCEVSPRQMLVRVLEAKLPKQVPDMVLFRVIARGDQGREEKIELVVKQDEKTGLSAMEQLTGFPAAAVALAIFLGKVAPGAHPQEQVIPYAFMKDQLAKFGIHI